MKRTNIYLDEGQSAALERVARTQGISRAPRSSCASIGARIRGSGSEIT
jgi:hypothetical protein